MKQKTPPPPLSKQKLDELALTYVARYATTEVKLKRYLSRKIKERGMVDGVWIDLDDITQKLTQLGFVNDEHYAQMKTDSLLRRGYGKQRVVGALRQAGIAESTVENLTNIEDQSAMNAAMAFAKRRRFGPFYKGLITREIEQKQIAAFLRAGHDYATVKYILKLDANCVQ